MTEPQVSTIQATGTALTAIVNTKEFTREVEWTSRFIQKSSIPILGNILLRSTAGSVELTTTDLGVGGITTVASAGDDFAITVPAKLALKYLKKVSEQELTLSVDGDTLTLRHGEDSECTLHGLAADQYPNLPAMPDSCMVLSGLTGALPRVTTAIAAEESRFTLNGALLVTGPAAKLVSTDGHRLSLVAITCDTESVTRAIVPHFALTELGRLAEDSVMYAADENHVHFVGEGRRIVARKLTGNFPDYERVIPAQTCSATIDADALRKHGERVALFADERSHALMFRLFDNKLTISANVNGTGKAAASVATTWEQPEWFTGLNWEYISDFLKLVPKTAFDLAFQPMETLDDGTKVNRTAVTLCVPGWDYVVMPLRV